MRSATYNKLFRQKLDEENFKLITTLQRFETNELRITQMQQALCEASRFNNFNAQITPSFLAQR